MRLPGQRASLARTLGRVDGAEQDQFIAQLAADITELLGDVRRERDRRRAAGADTGWLDEVIRDLEPAAEQIHDLEVFRAIRSVVARHGTGPYPADELATMANQKLSNVRRILDQMTAEGLGTPPDPDG